MPTGWKRLGTPALEPKKEPLICQVYSNTYLFKSDGVSLNRSSKWGCKCEGVSSGNQLSESNSNETITLQAFPWQKTRTVKDSYSAFPLTPSPKIRNKGQFLLGYSGALPFVQNQPLPYLLVIHVILQHHSAIASKALLWKKTWMRNSVESYEHGVSCRDPTLK